VAARGLSSKDQDKVEQDSAGADALWNRKEGPAAVGRSAAASRSARERNDRKAGEERSLRKRAEEFYDVVRER
jgi:hypothetical protein